MPTDETYFISKTPQLPAQTLKAVSLLFSQLPLKCTELGHLSPQQALSLCTLKKNTDAFEAAVCRASGEHFPTNEDLCSSYGLWQLAQQTFALMC